MSSITRRRRPLVVASLAAAIVAAVAATVSQASPEPSASFVLPAIKGPRISNATPGGCDFFFTTYGITCYGPYELGQAYDFPNNLDGFGQTIVIVDAYGSASIASDLHLFDQQFGIPDPAPGQLKIVNGPPATAAGSGDAAGWGLEVSLDVEYAHAMAPGAKIVLAVAPSDDDNDLNNTEAAILLHYPGAVVSHSFGDWETDEGAAQAAADAHRIYAKATLLGETLVASSGDAGATWTQYTGTTSPALAGYPASDPLVTGVGGTQGLPYDDGLLQSGAYGGEQVWNEADFDAAGGGAPSVLFRAPSWQLGVSGYRTRTVPDVSYNAAIFGGVGVVYTVPPPGLSDGTPPGTYIFLVGGTSSGSPQWAAIFALVNQARAEKHRGPIGFANDNLYRIARDPRTRDDFHDITVGSNALDSTVGFDARPGYDLASGLGTPDVAKLVPDLVNSPGGVFGGLDALLSAPHGVGHGRRHHTSHTAIPG